MNRGQWPAAGQTEVWAVLVIVRLPVDHGRSVKVFRGRRRIGFPLETRGGPGVRAGNPAVTHRPNQVEHRQQVAYCQNGSAGGGQHVEDLKLRRIVMITPRHPEVAEDELRKERQIEADEENHGRKFRETFRIEPAGNLRPPEVQASHVTHHCAAHHDVVEVGDNEVGIVDVNVQTEAGEEQAGEAANSEQANKAQSIKHGSMPGNRAFVEGGGPVEDFDRRRNGDQIAQEGEHQGCVSGYAGDKHVVGPNKEADDGDGDAGRCKRPGVNKTRTGAETGWGRPPRPD